MSEANKRSVEVTLHVDESACGLPESRPLRRAGLRLTEAEREAILYCVSCAQDYRERIRDGVEQVRLAHSLADWESPCDEATRHIEIAMRLGLPQTKEVASE
jgi:hypothetical protein